MSSPKAKKYAVIPRDICVACGCCLKVCPRGALSIYRGSYAAADPETCIGCGLCQRACPASIIELEVRNEQS